MLKKKKKNILILGGGTYSFARECYQWLLDEFKFDRSLAFKGFLGEKNALTKDLAEFYLGKKEDYDYCANDFILIGVGDPVRRKDSYNFFRKNNINLHTHIHPSAVMGRSCSIGEGSIVCPNCVFTCDIRIGAANLFNALVSVGHDVVMGEFNVVNSHADITGDVKIGDLNFFGTSCKVLPHSKIGSNCIFAPGSVVYKGCSDNSMLQGNPALKIKTLG